MEEGKPSVKNESDWGKTKRVFFWECPPVKRSLRCRLAENAMFSTEKHRNEAFNAMLDVACHCPQTTGVHMEVNLEHDAKGFQSRSGPTPAQTEFNPTRSPNLAACLRG